jgi:hypothetical protein
MQENNSQNAHDIIKRLKSAFSFKSNKQLATFLEIGSSTISSWKKRNSVDYNLIFTKCKDKIDLHWLVTGYKRLAANSTHLQIVGEGSPQYIIGDDETIRYVPSIASPFYINHLKDKDYVKKLPVVSIHEMLPPGLYRAFEMTDDSMLDIFSPGDRILGRYIDNYDKIINHQPYIIITEKDILIRKVINQLEVHQTLELHCQNSSYGSFTPITVNINEIKEMWRCVPPTLKMSILNGDTMESTSEISETKVIDLKDSRKAKK